MAYSVALDPNVKVAYAQQRWDKNSFDIGLESLKQVVSTLILAIHIC
jgi:hypothetical protein